MMGQLPAALGLQVSGLGNVVHNLAHINWWAFGIFSSMLTVLLLLAHFVPKFPWSILFAVIGVGIGYGQSAGLFSLGLETLLSRYNTIPRAVWDFTLYTDVQQLLDALNLDSISMLISGSLGISLIGILETLISARIADGYSHEHTEARRETFALLAGNLASGLMGGIPATAALARTSLNLRSGATSRMAGVINSIVVAVTSLAVLPYFSYVPMCVIAAILFMVAARMIDYHDMYQMFRLDKSMLSLCLFTASLCVFTDTTTGMMIGAVIALLMVTDVQSVGSADVSFLSKRGAVSTETPNLSELDRETADFAKVIQKAINPDFHNEAHEKFDDTLVYRITGNLTYVNSFAHMSRLERLSVAKYQHVIFSLRFVHYMDLDGALTFKQMIDLLHSKGIEVFISGPNRMVRRQLEKHTFYCDLQRQGKEFEIYLDALAHLRKRKDDVAYLDRTEVIEMPQ
jgi:sulfate permease, SulP family